MFTLDKCSFDFSTFAHHHEDRLSISRTVFREILQIPPASVIQTFAVINLVSNGDMVVVYT